MQNSWSNFVFVQLQYVAKSVMWHYAMVITVIDGMVSARQNTKMYYVTIPTTQYTNLPQKCTGATVHTYSDSSYKHKTSYWKFQAHCHTQKRYIHTKISSFSYLLTISVEKIVQPYRPDAKHRYCYKNTDSLGC